MWPNDVRLALALGGSVYNKDPLALVRSVTPLFHDSLPSRQADVARQRVAENTPKGARAVYPGPETGGAGQAEYLTNPNSEAGQGQVRGAQKKV